ncbi:MULTISPECIES: sigma-70 family RNA polymerase sigma factor [unclassified Mycobacterium]|uniref:sigma-70 family RNA polymerase sigma factor n=1 Tax=unclassified Mycobacterium TaxID=2642494 RepID=UPI0029C81C50|nr:MULTISPECIES: sigma-70 family RNA polymerase sigma factor [unclassified Mycobacterium]
MSAARPDWAALYHRHRNAMHRVAATTLRGRGLADLADDAVQAAMVSLMKTPPNDVGNWEALLVGTARRRALDMVESAAVRYAGPELAEEHDSVDPGHDADDIVDAVDRQRTAAQLRQHLKKLNSQQRFVAWEYLALDRPRAQVAIELGVSPARVSQIAKATILILRDAIGRRGGSE